MPNQGQANGNRISSLHNLIDSPHLIANQPQFSFAQESAFIGRARELDAIEQHFQNPACRLLSLIGIGGVGKTRIAWEVGGRMADNFAHGVCFVSLAASATPDLIVPAIAATISFTFQGSEPAQTQLINHLRSRAMLLILDNFEHLINGGLNLLTEILQAAPDVRLLVTSRERLNLREEWVIDIHGLDYPTDTSDAENFSAVQLFVQNAHRVKSDFQLTDSNRTDVIRICRLVEGMPLGIELAAAWVRSLSCSAIGDEIARNLDFLTTKLRNVPEKHRSMRAVFSHSYDQLTADQQRVFAKLSVFRGGFHREAAEAVAGASLTVLADLVDKSLLRVSADGRYDIHELLRQYSEEKLAQAGESETIHDAHCIYFAEFMHQRQERIKSGDSSQALDEIEADFENVRLMWRRASAQQNHDAVNQAMESLYLFNVMRSSFQNHQTMFDEARKHFGDESSPTWGRLMLRRNWFLGTFRSNLPQALMNVEIAHQIARRVGDTAEITLCVHIRGYLIMMDDPSEAMRCYQESLHHYEATGEVFYRVHLLHEIAYCYGLSQLPLAIATWHKVLEISRQHNIQTAIGSSLGPLGHAAAFGKGDYALGISHHEEAIRIFRDLRGRGEAARYMRWLSFLFFLQGGFDRAQTLAEEAHEIALDLHEFELLGITQSVRGMLANLKGDYQIGMELCQQGLEHSASKFILLVAHWALGWVYCGLDDMRQADNHLRAALQALGRLPFPGYIFCCLPVAAFVHANDPERAVGLLGLAFTHQATGWMEKWPLLTRLRAELEQTLGSVAYAAAWERGKLLDADVVNAELQAGFAPKIEINQSLQDPLTERELEVLNLLANGLSNTQIAQQLIIAIGTTKSHIHNIYSKLQVETRVQAVTRARELNLL